MSLIKNCIIDVKLEIQTSKTQVFYFKRIDDKLTCGQEFKNGLINWNKNFSYLGFDFNGESILIKSSSISKYYRKMKKTIALSKYFSIRNFDKYHGELFKRRILNKFSHRGAKRKRKWIRNESNQGFIKSDYYNWGNYLSYVYKAEKVMNNPKIRIQLKKHWKILNKLLKIEN